MTDPGLNHRLRQRSRRSGIMIGLSMLLTLGVCVASFTLIYAELEPVVADFVGRGDIKLPTAVPTEPPPPTAVPAADAPAEPTATEEVETGGDNQAGEIEKTSDAFEPDLQIDATQPINLRPGPGVASGDAIIALRIGQPLQSLNEEEETTDPERDQMDPGQTWVKVRTEDGREGWVREIDLTEYVP